MIFVTVGTHEQQFNRLIQKVDELKKEGAIEDEVVIQTGFSTYEPKCCKWQKLFAYDEMRKNVEDARIVITHGGPSSFIMPLQMGKVPIVVPRQAKYDEHVNDHQLAFCRQIADRQKNIILVEDTDEVLASVLNYDSLSAGLKNGSQSNNSKFCERFKEIVDDMFK